MQIFHRALTATAAALAIAASGAASASIVFDFSGNCIVDCARFGIPNGTDFTEPGVLKLKDGTNTSAGALLQLEHFESFVLFGIDFLSGNTLLPTTGSSFEADNVLGGFVLTGGNSFCYHLAQQTCRGGRWDTIVNGGSPAPEDRGHGVGVFTLAAPLSVPEPASAALAALALLGVAAAGRRRT